MASLVPCPHCGSRPKEEFTIRGAVLQRPSPADDPEKWFDYVYLRDNPRGAYEEYWHHTAGCRRWLVVCRDTMTHQVTAGRDTASKGQAA